VVNTFTEPNEDNEVSYVLQVANPLGDTGSEYDVVRVVSQYAYPYELGELVGKCVQVVRAFHGTAGE